MKDDLEVRVHRALAHVAPTPSADADLAGALAAADMVPAPGVRRSLWIGVAVAAVLIAAVGVVVLRREPAGGPAPKKIAAAPLDGRTIRIHVDAAGSVVVDDLSGAPRAYAELGSAPGRAADGLSVIKRALAEFTVGVAREADGTSPVALELAPDPRARWRWIQWVMQAAADPDVKMVTMRFGSEPGDGTLIEQRLPTDRSIGSAEEPESVGLKITLLAPSLQPGVVTISFAGHDGPAWAVHLDSSPAPKDFGDVEVRGVVADVRAALRASAEAAGTLVHGQIEVPPPRGDGVTYEIVHEVLRAFREAGIDDVRFNGAALPK